MASNTHPALTHPELDEEKRVGRPLLKQLLHPSLLLRELIVDLSDVHCLQVRITEGRVGLSDVHKQVLVKLENTEREREMFITLRAPIQFMVKMQSWCEEVHVTALRKGLDEKEEILFFFMSQTFTLMSTESVPIN